MQAWVAWSRFHSSVSAGLSASRTTRDSLPRIHTTIAAGSFTTVLADRIRVLVGVTKTAHFLVLFNLNLRMFAGYCDAKPDER